MDLQPAPGRNRQVPTQGNILAGDQFAQAALVWITLSISGQPVYHHVSYCGGRAGHRLEVLLSGDGAGWNKWPGSEATLGQARGLIWKDSSNYKSPEVQASPTCERPQTGRCTAPRAAPPRKAGRGVDIFNLLRSILHRGGHVGLEQRAKKRRKTPSWPLVWGVFFFQPGGIWAAILRFYCCA